MKLREVPPTAGLPLQWQDFRGTWLGARAIDSASLESLLANYLELSEPVRANSVIASSGTACLVLGLELLKKVSKRKNVIIPAFSCPLVVQAIEQAQLNVIFCDIQNNHFDFDFSQLERLSDAETLCLIPTHLGGIPADVSTAKRIAAKVGAYVLEDSAQALGAKSGRQFVGTIGDIGVFSLTRGKGLSIFEAGLLVVSNPALQSVFADVIAALLPAKRFAEWVKSMELIGLWLFYNPFGLRLTYGCQLRYWLQKGEPEKAVGDLFDSRIDVHAVGHFRKQVGANAFYRLQQFTLACREQAARRLRRLNKIAGMQVLDAGDGCTATYPFFMLLFDRPADCEESLRRLWTSAMGVTKLFCKSLTDAGGAMKRPMSLAANASSFAARCLTISNSPMLEEWEFETICSTIEDVLRSSDSASQAQSQARESTTWTKIISF